MAMILETERLRIRELTLGDAPFILELVNDPDWKRFISDRKIHTIEAAKEYLQNILIPSYTNWGFGFYLVAEKETETPIGISGFVDRDELESVDVGFAFLPIGRGKGYAYEATKALLEYGKNTLKFDVILGIANNDNERSHSLLKKLGLRFDKFVKLHDDEKEISLFTNQ